MQMPFPKPYADAVAKLRVPGGFLLAAGFFWLAAPTPLSLAAGLPVTAAGLALRAWAAGHLAKNQDLAISGPYAYIRNPLYGGTLLTAGGLVIASRRWELAILYAVVFGLVYLPVIQLEEQHLSNLFPAFRSYRERVPLLLPQGRRTDGRLPFRGWLYRKNEEYKALLAALAAVAWLLWRLV